MIKTITFLAAMMVGMSAVAQNIDSRNGITYMFLHNIGQLIIFRDDARTNTVRTNAAIYCEIFKDKKVRTVKMFTNTSGTVVRENSTDSSMDSVDKGYIETDCL